MKFQERMGMAILGFSLASLLFMLHDLSSVPEPGAENHGDHRAETPLRLELPEKQTIFSFRDFFKRKGDV